MKRLALLCLVAFSVWRPSAAQAAFSDPYWSARVAALGGAFTALSDDPTGILYNPAAMVKMKDKQANFSHARLFMGLDEVKLSLSQFAYAQPLGENVVAGLAWGRLDSSSLYSEDTVAVSYARRLKRFFPKMKEEIAVAVSVRYLTRGFTMDERSSADPVFASGSRVHAAAVDAHLFAALDPEILRGLSMGLSLKSLNRPEVGFKDRERVPVEIAGGLLYERGSVLLPVDVVQRNGQVRPRFGSEFRFFNGGLALRAGSDLSQAGGGFGLNFGFPRGMTLGLDYGVLFPLEVADTAGSHRATLAVKF